VEKDMSDFEEILDGKICMRLMSSSIGNPDGTHPLCLGIQCTDWYECVRNLIASQHDIDELLKPIPWYKRIFQQ
jgi:hypothetical protein